MTDLFAAVDHTQTDRDEILNKWKDKPAEELLKAKVESDLYIKTLEKQKDELRADYLKQREELLAKAKFEELIDRYEKAPKDMQVAPPPANDDISPKFDPKQLEEMVTKKISESKVLEKETTNFNAVQQKLQERFGDKFLSVLNEQQNTLGLSREDVNALARSRSPDAFFRIMELNQQPDSNFQSPPRSGLRNDSFAPTGGPKRTWSYYQNLKKTNYELYSNPKTQVQMHKDAAELGSTFEDGDFKL